MKKYIQIIFISALLLGVVAEGSAKTCLLLKGGGNFSKLLWDPSIEDVAITQRIGMALGGGIEFRSENAAFEIDVLYEQKGAKLNCDEILYNSTDYYLLDYLNIPFIAKGLLKNEYTSSFIGVGLGFGFLLSAKDEWIATILNGPTSAGSVNQKDIFKTLDVTAIATIGIEISRLVLEGRFSYGLVSIYEIRAADYRGSINTISMACLIGFRI